ncbi:AAA family ATPase [Mesorhizobium sp. M0029]|uniref:AAA family ATPase n=1 Tax=Mesorhizobium sp. M0029 TaxID=2956850 RepID=UPI00333CB5B7
MKIQNFRIRRFKVIEDTSVGLSDLNIIVGSNNSGKSSIIQALHFCISILQSIALAKKWTRKSPLIATLGPDEIIYSPASNPYALGQGGKLVEGENRSILFDLTLENGRTFSLEVAKGKNNNVQARIVNPEVAVGLASLDDPFSIFSPGLAGVAKSEVFVSDGVLLRALARGDANVILRNMLLRLWPNEDNRNRFLVDLAEVFPGVEIDVIFEQKIDEYIYVFVKKDGTSIPIELCGTGFLQAVQILCYLHRFRPSLIVLDEPDSHLHPNNQRIISNLLFRITEDLGTQIVITTHSRHIVDALSGVARYIWVQSGAAAPASRDDQIDILMDLGALDLKERIGTKNYDAILLTEDEITRSIVTLLASSGFDMERTLILPYRGVTELHNLRTIADHTRRISGARLVIHRDRDFLDPMEVEAWKTSIREMQCDSFVTTGVDIESHLLNPRYLSALNNLQNEAQFTEILNQAIEEIREDAYEHALNSRLDWERKQGNGRVNVGALARDMRQRVNDDPRANMSGKKLLKKIRDIYRQRVGANLTVGTGSELIRDDSLLTIANRIFPRRRENQ